MIIDSWTIYLLGEFYIIDASVVILLFWLLPMYYRLLCTGSSVTHCSTIPKTIFTFSPNKLPYREMVTFIMLLEVITL